MRAIAIVLLLWAGAAQGEELAAICRYEYSINEQGQKQGTSGEFSMKAAYKLPIGESLNVQVRTELHPVRLTPA
jgi:hypothetical protein